MCACVQRVAEARVTIAGEIVGEIGRGLVVLLGVAADDSADDVRYLAEKIVGLRIFPDEAGKMNRDLAASGGAMLIVSQFTLFGDCRKGRRPSFIAAAGPDLESGSIWISSPRSPRWAFRSPPADFASRWTWRW